MNGSSRSRDYLPRSGLNHTRSGNIRVLVPGAGLGRLAYDIAKLGKPYLCGVIPPAPLVIRPRSGFTCQGNEFSLFMLLTSSLILNKFRFHPTLNFRSLTKTTTTIGRNSSTNTCCIPTSTRSPTFQKQAHCSARSRYPTCYLQISRLGRTFPWSQVRTGRFDRGLKLNRGTR